MKYSDKKERIAKSTLSFLLCKCLILQVFVQIYNVIHTRTLVC